MGAVKTTNYTKLLHQNNRNYKQLYSLYKYNFALHIKRVLIKTYKGCYIL